MVTIWMMDIMLRVKNKRDSFYKNNNKGGHFFFCVVTEKKRNSSEVLQNSPGGRVLLSIELDSVSSSYISGNADFFRPDVVGSSVHGAFSFGGSASELSVAHLLAFFGL